MEDNSAWINNNVLAVHQTVLFSSIIPLLQLLLLCVVPYLDIYIWEIYSNH